MCTCVCVCVCVRERERIYIMNISSLTMRRKFPPQQLCCTHPQSVFPRELKQTQSVKGISQFCYHGNWTYRIRNTEPQHLKIIQKKKITKWCLWALTLLKIQFHCFTFISFRRGRHQRRCSKGYAVRGQVIAYPRVKFCSAAHSSLFPQFSLPVAWPKQLNW